MGCRGSTHPAGSKGVEITARSGDGVVISYGKPMLPEDFSYTSDEMCNIQMCLMGKAMVVARRERPDLYFRVPAPSSLLTLDCCPKRVNVTLDAVGVITDVGFG